MVSATASASPSIGAYLDWAACVNLLPDLSSQFAAWKKLSSIVPDHNRVSSTHFVLFGMEEVISSYRLVF